MVCIGKREMWEIGDEEKFRKKIKKLGGNIVMDEFLKEKVKVLVGEF